MLYMVGDSKKIDSYRESKNVSGTKAIQAYTHFYPNVEFLGFNQCGQRCFPHSSSWLKENPVPLKKKKKVKKIITASWFMSSCYKT